MATHPKKQQFIDLDIFRHALRLLIDYRRTTDRMFERLSLNHYNEPLLDSRFAALGARALETGIFRSLLVNTNLSHLPDRALDALEPFKDQILWNLNVPSADRARYALLHGRDEFDRIVANAATLRERGFTACINMQQNLWTDEEDRLGVIRTFAPMGIGVESSRSRSRAGAVPELGDIRHEGAILGCVLRRPRTVMNIGVDGALFLCCEDYDKTSSFGYVQDYEVVDDLVARWSREIEPIYGQGELGAEHICRRCNQAVTASRRHGRK